MKTIETIQKEVLKIIRDNPTMSTRLQALGESGYHNVNYAYQKKGQGGLGFITHLKTKNIYRIQVGYTELKKGYPCSWCIDIPASKVSAFVEQPF